MLAIFMKKSEFRAKSARATFLCLAALLSVVCVNAQDPTGTLQGEVSDPSSAVVSGAEVSAKNTQTGLTRTVHSSREGSFSFTNLPVSEYSLNATAGSFAPFSISPIRIDVGHVVTYKIALELAGSHTTVNVDAQVVTVDTSQTIGNVVSAAQAADLPLNGRDLTQLGLLQPGVAPMTTGLAESGGIARRGQPFAVNGQRPESNLNAKDKALLRFTTKVTKNLSSIVADDVAAVRAAGWDDEAIYYAITTCALFNFYNRWITATGVPEMSPASP
jgi:alkylhydroperoxidase family enzyme